MQTESMVPGDLNRALVNPDDASAATECET